MTRPFYLQVFKKNESTCLNKDPCLNVHGSFISNDHKLQIMQFFIKR